MEIQFLGAAKEVTGSMHVIRVGDFDVVLDAGKFNGPLELTRQKNSNFLINPPEIERIILSHSHLDHSGRLPIMMKRGFKGKIFTTRATADVIDVILRDAAEIEADHVERMRKTTKHNENIEPLFTYKDVRSIYSHLTTYDYYKEFDLSDTISVTFYDAGHILGSAITKLTIREKQSTTTVLYTGDLGRPNMPFVRDPDTVEEGIDYVITETTYGDSLHEPLKKTVDKIKNLVIWIYRHSGKLIVPSFALGRTQDLIYLLNELVEHGQIPVVPTYIDSPLALDIVDLYKSHKECYDKETWELINSGDNPLEFKGLHFVRDNNESRDLDYQRGPAIIISSSGMCTGGRILRHLYHFADDKNTAILFTGYQAEGTLGRHLLDGARDINIYGKKIKVRARIEHIDGLSAHADQKELFNYLKSIGSVKKVFLVHGEKHALNVFSKLLRKHNYSTYIPSLGDTWKPE